MINVIAQVDWLASAGRSVWHRASALAKLLFATLTIGLAVFAPSLALQAALYLLAWALVVTARVPARLVLAATMTPLLVVALLVVLRWNGSPLAALVLVLRPLTATLVALWLIATTPYPDLFAPISRVLPRGSGDALFLTYRALFEFLGRAERLFRAMHLRGADHVTPRRRLTAAGEGLGTLVLHSFERSERLYAIMLVRGHSGRVCGCHHWAEWTRADLAVGGAALLVATLALALWGRA